MPKSLIELHQERGRLLERIATQRSTLARQLAPVRRAFEAGDRAIAAGRGAVDYLLQHPGAVAALVAVLAGFRPRRLWRWARRGLWAWSSWRALRRWLPDVLERWLQDRPARPG